MHTRRHCHLVCTPQFAVLPLNIATPQCVWLLLKGTGYYHHWITSIWASEFNEHSKSKRFPPSLYVVQCWVRVQGHLIHPYICRFAYCLSYLLITAPGQVLSAATCLPPWQLSQMWNSVISKSWSWWCFLVGGFYVSSYLLKLQPDSLLVL